MSVFRALALTGAALAFAIAVLGSWVRINHAGMTCPDWPLCNGRVVPAMAGGVALEWTHRLFVLIESLVLVALVVTGVRLRRRVVGLTAALWTLGGIFVLQVVMGAFTVWLGNVPLSVTVHWALAMSLLATLVTLTALAFLAPSPEPHRSHIATGAPSALGLAALFALLTTCIGAFVSSSNAGLACSTFPSCGGTVLGHDTGQLVQMLHRIAAFAFVATALGSTVYAWPLTTSSVRIFAAAGCLLALAQFGLGVANVVLALPTSLREAHAANAVLTFACFVVATVLAALEPLSRERTLGERPRVTIARASAR